MRNCELAHLLLDNTSHHDIDGLIHQVMNQVANNGEEADYNKAVVGIINFLNHIGVSQNDIADIFSTYDALSQDKLNGVAMALRESFIVGNLIEKVRSFPHDTYEETTQDMEEDEFDGMPPRKAGYKRKQVVRNGKKKWVNKRNSNKPYKMSPKQKMALKKAQRKAHTGKAKTNRARSNRIRR